MTTPVNHFDRSKPFYPIVMGYLFQLFGLKEMLVRGAIGKRVIRMDDLEKHIQNNN